MNWSKLNVKALNSDAINTHSVRKDWSYGWSETWEDVDPRSAMTLADLRERLNDIGVEYDPDETDEDRLLSALLDSDDSGDEWMPVMSYYYPLPDYSGNPEYDQLLLHRASLSVALVALIDGDGDRDYVLALTGCGMDLSWDIASAFILLGYLPPAWLRLPRFSGHKSNAQTRAVLRAMRRQLAVRRNWLAGDARDLMVVAGWVKNGGK